ncbi:MAG: molybdopterin-binding oxidoreductase, partial [Meiothermus sp.]
MKRSDWTWGLTAGLVLGLLGLALRGAGVAYPLEGLFAQITYALGTPAVFNLLHGLFGYGELAKNLAFAGAALAWLLAHPLLGWAARRSLPLGLGLAFAAYAASAYVLPGGWLAAGLYALIFAGLVRVLRRRPRAPAGGAGRRESLRTLALLAAG